jgi:hypothetical protein
MAYEVAGENLRQVRHAAERLRHGTYQSGDITDDMSMVINRLVRLGMDLSTTWFQMVGAMMRDPRLVAAFEETGRAGPPRTRRTPSGAPPRITRRVRCSKRFDVTHSLSPATGPAVPTVAGLFPVAPNADPIRSVTFKHDAHTGSLVLDIDVPDTQPAGTYNGVITNRDNNEPIGTVRLQIFA